VDLERFLYALGIPEVGVTVARDLARHYRSLAALRSATVESLQEVGGVGPKMTDAIVAFLSETHNREVLDQLAARTAVIEPEVAPAAATPLAGKKLVFTGGLEGLSRGEARKLVEAAGGRVVASVSKATDYVVVGESPGAKARKAEELGIETLDEEALRALLGLAKGRES